MDKTMNRGVIYYNKGTKCLIRLLVSINSLRKHYTGPVTIISNGEESHRVCKQISEIAEYNLNYKEFDSSFIPEGSSTVFLETTLAHTYTPYDITIWLDSDTLVRGSIDELFDLAEEHDMVVPHFAGWSTQKGNISKRIRYWEQWYPNLIEDAINYGSAINCGVIAFKNSSEFMKNWYKHTLPGRDSFIPNETCMQVILPQYKHKLVEGKFNCSCKYGPVHDADTRVIHYHGRKHVRVPKEGSNKIQFGGDLWVSEFEEVIKKNPIDITNYVPGDDKQLRQYLEWKDNPEKYHSKHSKKNKKNRKVKTKGQHKVIEDKRTTIVTAVTPNYLEKLKLTLPTWKIKPQFKGCPLIVFVHGFENLADLDFIKSEWSNSRIVQWSMDKYDSMRELMLSAFVFGAAAEVETPYTIKIDCDSFFLDSKDVILDHMYDYDIAGHKWRYTKPGKWIADLDEWANKSGIPGDRYLNEEQTAEALNTKRYGHKRIASWICLHKTSFLLEISAFAGNSRLPVPSHDTFVWYMANRLPDKKWCWHNFKSMGCGTHTDIEVAKTRISEIAK
jgi:lipopolysaccharide biosynthesis glycosyltransferase